MKKLFLAIVSVTMVFGLMGCGGDSNRAPKEKVFIEESEISAMYSSPKDYKDKYVNLTGKIFKTPEEKDGMIAFQMWNDPENNDKNTVVVCDKAIAADLEIDSYIKVTGYIKGEFEGTNMMGGKVSAPQIYAESIEKSDYLNVVAPTKKSVDVNQTVEQNSVSITLNKIEFADKETRVYVTVNNQSSDKFRFYSFNTKVTQGSSQYDEDRYYGSDYPEINSEILAGIKAEGVLVFPKLEQSQLTLICEGYSDNYRLDFEDYKFDVAI